MNSTHQMTWLGFLPRLIACVGLLLGLGFLQAAHAATYSAESNLTTVDTRGRLLSVSGRVRDSETGSSMAGVRVSLAGQNTITFGDGNFAFTGIAMSDGLVVTASKVGFVTAYRTVAAPAGALAVALSDLLLVSQPDGDNPVVTEITAKYEGLFISGAAILNEYTATVAWGGSTPATVEFSVNGGPARTVAASGDRATATIDMGVGFFGSFTLGANKISAVAVDANGGRSKPFVQSVTILPAPGFLALAPFQWIPGNDPILSYDIQFPDRDIPSSALRDIPFLGRFGWQMSVGGGFEYALNSGEWNLHAGLIPSGRWKDRVGERPHSSISNPKFFAGNREISFSAMGQAEGTATQTGGIQVQRVGIHLGVDFEQEILSFYLSDFVLAARWLKILDAFKAVGVDINSIQRVNVYGLLKADLDLNAELLPPPIHLPSAKVVFAFGVKAAYEPDLIGAKGSIYVGGEIAPEFQIAPTFEFNKVTGKVYGGITFTVFLFKVLDEQFVLLNYSWPAGARRSSLSRSSDGDEWVVIPVESNGEFTLDRRYLNAGPERFVGFDAAQTSKTRRWRSPLLSSGYGSPLVSSLEAFRRMGRSDVIEASRSGGIARPQSGPSVGGSAEIGQGDLPIVENVFPDSNPSMARHEQDLMLIYVTDNGSPNSLQFTDIKWTRFDGTNWSVPAAIHADSQAEFSPQVTFDGNGDAIAVWERVADPNFNQSNLTAMAAQMEIVWAKWNHLTQSWSTPVPLTSNGHLDHAPLLCGPMTDGSVLATWTSNEANQLMGTEDNGSHVFWARWSPASQNWTPPQVLIPGLSFRLSQSLSGVGDRAVYAWTRDLDGTLANANDQQVFYREWNNGVWGAATQLTSDSNGNRNARVSVGQDGHNYLVWQSGTNLVLSRDFAANFSLVRADSQIAGFADFAMTVGPAGNLVLLWQEISEAGSDAHYRILDPASGTWSRDAKLFNDAPLERSFAPVWDDVGNLTVAYNKVDIIFADKTVTLEGGGTVTIPNVPQPGRVDLNVTKRRLIKDVALEPGDFTVSAENYLPGAAVTLSATLRNAGDVAVINPAVAFYDGNPATGGILITNIALSGWLEGAATNVFSAIWIVPEPATNHVLYAVADPGNSIAEFDEGNNAQFLRVGGADLVVSLINYNLQASGAMRVIAQVRNTGAPMASRSVLAIRKQGQGVVLASIEVSALEPGSLAQVAIDTPPGTVSEGESVFELTADDLQSVADINRANNKSSFAVNRFMDSDGDGMPDQWERDNRLDPADASDAAKDADGDGVSNLAEYLAGTDPGDPKSYLRMEAPVLAGFAEGVRLTWGSVPNKLYTILRTADLNGGWIPVAEHVLSTPPETVFLDRTATIESQYFYRLRIE